MEPLNVEHAGRTLRGVLHLPHPHPSPAPAVVLCHGLGGNRIGWGNDFVLLSRLLAAQGIACYRFDFAAFGESDGDPLDFSVSDQVSQLKAVLAQLERNRAVAPDRISVLGFSMGALVAVLAAGDRRLRSLALWAPAGGPLNLPFWESFRDEIREHGRADYNGIEFGDAFIDDLRGIDQFAAARRHEGPVLLAGGTEDGLMRDELIDPYREAWGDRLEQHWIEGMGHGFGSLANRDRMFEAALAFLSRTV
ncbi:alpha/beta hydrolase [Glycomyces niveus]|uniref:Alpha/beta fold hydrolase n=1 Tax=Glycomyces niveus TaxID=2820287 RepID=A0ABS3U3W9_9ACTN|nr:alpha/beta fold hydrolase [Glycomyces sp. NEAU-S30]MBO3733474.1 alpha/beta fold hydrolase [Glycomyces sp. NEAU-S30]